MYQIAVCTMSRSDAFHKAGVSCNKKKKNMETFSEFQDRVDDLLSEVALGLVNVVAKSRKFSPHHVALLVPGLCHTHCPDGRVVNGCAYCARRGNCFAGPQNSK